MPRRTTHGQQRHEQGDRPTRAAFHDREHALEHYLDEETGYLIYIGREGRTHVFTQEGAHHTSFYTSRRGRLNRVAEGKWRRLRDGASSDPAASMLS